jgi:hypothetical protein
MAQAQSIFGGPAAGVGTAFGDFGAGISDIFAGIGAGSKAQGDYAEASMYNEAADWANKEAQFATTSMNIQQYQLQRQLTQSLSQTSAEQAGAGFAASGSGLDILRDSASQGALTQAVAHENGLISIENFQQQASADEAMANAAVQAGNAQGKPELGDYIGGAFKAIAGIAALPLA